MYRLLERAVGQGLYVLGRWALRRGDVHNYNHAVAALRAGDCTELCQGSMDRL